MSIYYRQYQRYYFVRWILAFHLIFVISWFAGLFYLPRLFVYHAMAEDNISKQRFKIMEQKLYFRIMIPAGILAIFFGLWLLLTNYAVYMQAHWMHWKLSLVIGLILFQVYCGKLLMDFKYDRNKHSPIFYRVLNELPMVLLALIVILVIVRP